MLQVSDLPLLNALLNGMSLLLLLAGHYFIRRKLTSWHRLSMIGAFSASVLFLVSYLVYHAQVGTVRYTGAGFMRAVYLSILLTHTVTAAAVPPMAIITLSRAVRGRFDRHRLIARWTYPVWLYVSATGVMIYILLYRLQPAAF